MHDFVAMGSKLAHQTVEGAALADDAAGMDRRRGGAPDPSLAFERIGRTVRRSILMADSLAKAARAAAQGPSPAADPGPQRRIAARKRIIREVEDVIQRGAEDDEAAEELEAELLDRLDSPELEEEIDHRPVAEIIADICRDLGLAAAPGSHPWRRRTPADVAALCALAARPRGAPPERGGGSPAEAATMRRGPARRGPTGRRAGRGRSGPEDFAREEPGCDEPGWDEPGCDEPGWEEPGREEPSGHEPGGDELDAPGRDAPGLDDPGGGEPGGGERSPPERAGYGPGSLRWPPGLPAGHATPRPPAPIAPPVPPPRPARPAGTLLHGPPWTLGR